MAKPYTKDLKGVTFIEQLTQDNSVSEGFSEQDTVGVYNSMTSSKSVKRQYDMDEYVRFPRTHPEYLPDVKEKLLNDSNDILNQQYMTMILTITATASLGIIAFMVTASSPQ